MLIRREHRRERERFAALMIRDACLARRGVQRTLKVTVNASRLGRAEALGPSFAERSTAPRACSAERELPERPCARSVLDRSGLEAVGSIVRRVAELQAILAMATPGHLGLG